MRNMAIILAFFIILNIVFCNGFPWRNAIPVDLKEVIEIHEEESIRTIYVADKLKDVLEVDPLFSPDGYFKSYALSKITGKNCGSQKEAIHVNSVVLPKVIVLGANASVSLDATIKRDIVTASLLQVVVQKVGLPVDIPCLENFGTCNYTNPCDILKTIKCPPEIVKLGWNCRCPLLKKRVVVPQTTLQVPEISLPAFMIDGTYTAKIQLFNGTEELLCYQIQLTLKKKE